MPFWGSAATYGVDVKAQQWALFAEFDRQRQASDAAQADDARGDARRFARSGVAAASRVATVGASAAFGFIRHGARFIGRGGLI